MEELEVSIMYDGVPLFETSKGKNCSTYNLLRVCNTLVKIQVRILLELRKTRRMAQIRRTMKIRRQHQGREGGQGDRKDRRDKKNHLRRRRKVKYIVHVHVS